jgi:hypothetical protein
METAWLSGELGCFMNPTPDEVRAIDALVDEC